jgi:hypothetical protein
MYRPRVDRLLASALAIALLASLPTAGRAQQASTTATPASAPSGPGVGEAAPDFVLPGATRFGVLREPIRLSDFRGKTVVIAFFYKARTKG